MPPTPEPGKVIQAERFKVVDKDGKVGATLGYIGLKDKRTGSVEKRTASSLVLFGEDGKVIWEAP